MIGHAPSDSSRYPPPIDDHRHGWVILPRISSYSRRTCIIGFASKAFTLWWTKSRSSDFDLYFASNRHGWDLLNMAPTHCWPLSRLSDFTSHFAYITLYPKSDLHHRAWLEGCCRSDEQSHGWEILTCISLITHHAWPGLAPSDSSRWLSLIDDHRHGWVILHPSGLPRRRLRSDEQVTVEWFWLVFHLLSNRYDRDLHHRTHLDGFHIFITIVTIVGFYHVFSIF